MLRAQVIVRILPKVVLEQNQRRDQRDAASPVRLEQAQQLLFVVCAEIVLEVAHHVHKHIHLPSATGLLGHNRHKARDVVFTALRQILFTYARHHASEFAVKMAASRHKHQFVAGMKLNETTDIVRVEHLPTVPGKYTLEEVFSDGRIVEAALLFSWYERITLLERLGKDASPTIIAGSVLLFDDRHAFHSTAR